VQAAVKSGVAAMEKPPAEPAALAAH